MAHWLAGGERICATSVRIIHKFKIRHGEVLLLFYYLDCLVNYILGQKNTYGSQYPSVPILKSAVPKSFY